jgi:hypothetical protein
VSRPEEYQRAGRIPDAVYDEIAKFVRGN